MSEDAWLARVRAANERGETLVDLDAVAAWMRRLTPRWEARGLTVAHFPVTRDVPKNSVRMDIDGLDFVSTTMVWGSGEWEVGIGRVTDEHTQTTAYDPGTSTDDVLKKLEQAFAALGMMELDPQPPVSQRGGDH